MRIGTYYGDAAEPAEIIEVDADIAKEFISTVARDMRRDNKRHKLTDRIAEIDADGAFVRWLS